MSHFSVMVIGDVESQLAPYQENNMGDCPMEYMEFNDCTEEVEDEYKERDEEYKSMSMEKFAEEYFGYKLDPDKGKYGYWENPNKKWDWYQTGGRYSGLLITKAGSKVDHVTLRDLDLDAMKAEQIKNRHNNYDHFEKWLKNNDYREGHPIMTGVRSRPLPSGDREFFTREEHVSRALFYCYAIVHDGKWSGSADMGWFGISSNEKPPKDFNHAVETLLNSIEDKSVPVTMIDCHI